MLEIKSKLAEVENYCDGVVKLLGAESSKNAYAGGRCITAEEVLRIIRKRIRKVRQT